MMEPGVSDAYTEFPGQSNVEAIMETAQMAATADPKFGSVAQSIGDNIAPVSDVTVTLEGRHPGGESDFESVVTIVRSDSSELVIDTRHEIDDTEFVKPPEVPLEGHNKLVFYATTDALTSVDELTLARVVTLWNPYDAGEWMSGGFWIHGNVDPEGNELSGSELGAFIDGPGLSGTESLPEGGRAIYTGYSGGYYTAEIGSGSDNFPEGTLTTGEYWGSLVLTADFGSEAMISGSIDDIVIGGYAYTPSGNEVKFSDEPVNGQVVLKSATLSSDGRATGSVSISGNNVASSEGVWGVQLSSLPDDIGNPRAAGGTSGVIYMTDGGSEVALVGMLYGLSTELSAPSPAASGN